jgi:hypothetical protein
MVPTSPRLSMTTTKSLRSSVVSHIHQADIRKEVTMEIKEGVRLQGLQPEMIVALMIAKDVWDDYGQRITITSATDGPHSDMSLHYCGRALDFRTRYFDEETRPVVYDELVKALGSQYDVVYHSTHIHVEYDPK